MSLEQRGLYRELLDLSWIEGALPNDPQPLAVMVGVSVEDFKRLWTGTLPLCWRKRNGKLINPKLELEREFAQQRKEASRRGAEVSAKVRRKRNLGGERHQSGTKAVPEREASYPDPDPDPDPDPKEKDLSANGRSQDRSKLEVVPPVFWDNEQQDVVIDTDWLREELAEYTLAAGVTFTQSDYERCKEDFRLRLLEESRLRACLRTTRGRRSADSQFRRMETLTLGFFKRAIRYKAGRAAQKKVTHAGLKAFVAEGEAK